MSSTPLPPSPRPGGRGLLWLGVLAAIAGPILYGAQLDSGRFWVPWYAVALAFLGAGLVFLSLKRRPSIVRGLALLFCLVLAGFEIWFLLSFSRQPPYEGPVAVGQPFPEFVAQRPDGTPFTQADLVGDQNTVLVFYRGHW